MTQGPTPTHTRSDVVAVFEATETPGTPLTASEVAEELGCARRTAYGKLESLAASGALETKKVGARGRVWWRVEGPSTTPEEAPEATVEAAAATGGGTDGDGEGSDDTDADGSAEGDGDAGGDASADADVDGDGSLAEAQFREFVETVSDYAIFVLDEKGRVRTWNEGARRAKGYEEEEILGEHVSTFYTEADREAGRPETNLARAAAEGRVEDEGWRVRKDGSRFWANVVITARYGEGGDLRGYTKVTRDMTERHDYEQRLREQRDELDELNQINTVIRDIDQALVAATSRDGIEEAVCERLAASETYAAAWVGEYGEEYETMTARTAAGVDAPRLDAVNAGDGDGATAVREAGAVALRTGTVQRVGELVSGDSESESGESVVAVPLVHEDVEYGVLVVSADRASAFDERKVAVMAELGETISHAVAAVRRKERERTLTALQQSTRDLLHAETHEEIGDIIVTTLTDELTLDDACVYHFDAAENTLDAVSWAARDDGRASETRALDAGAGSAVWQAFVDGDTGVVGAGSDTLVVPLGEHGVLAVSAPGHDGFSGNTRNLVELVAATAEAAFDRVESQATLRERDELLQEQNQRLQRVNQVSTIIRDVDQALVEATTRDEIQRVVCERLTRSDRFRFAWIGTPTDSGEALAPAAQSGQERGYLDDVDLAPAPAEAAEPAVTALRTGNATVVSNVAENLRDGQWRADAFSREFQSVISVPLHYGDVTYGVLSVYADRPGVFEEMEESVFVELGETIANAVNAVESKRALLSDRVVEIDFHLGDDASVLGRLARRLDADLTVDAVLPLADDRVRVFFAARDVDADAVTDALAEVDAVESSQHLGTAGDRVFVEAVVAGPSVVGALAEYGAALGSLTPAVDGLQLTAELPGAASVREFVEWLRGRYASTEFVARRERERAPKTREGIHAELDDVLTDRQREILETAYYSGFFLTPRQSTGTDVADMLGVSQPTVSEQLRTAQRKLLDVILDGRTADSAASTPGKTESGGVHGS